MRTSNIQIRSLTCLFTMHQSASVVGVPCACALHSRTFPHDCPSRGGEGGQKSLIFQVGPAYALWATSHLLYFLVD